MERKTYGDEYEDATQTLDSMTLTSVLYEISWLLDCGVPKNTLSILVSLVENGVNPEAVAAVYKELIRETEALWVSTLTVDCRIEL